MSGGQLRFGGLAAVRRPSPKCSISHVILAGHSAAIRRASVAKEDLRRQNTFLLAQRHEVSRRRGRWGALFWQRQGAALPGYTRTDLLPERDRHVAAVASPMERIGEPGDAAEVRYFSQATKRDGSRGRRSGQVEASSDAVRLSAIESGFSATAGAGGRVVCSLAPGCVPYQSHARWRCPTSIPGSGTRLQPTAQM